MGRRQREREGEEEQVESRDRACSIRVSPADKAIRACAYAAELRGGGKGGAWWASAEGLFAEEASFHPKEAQWW